jgi:hypothetical protein
VGAIIGWAAGFAAEGLVGPFSQFTHQLAEFEGKLYTLPQIPEELRFKLSNQAQDLQTDAQALSEYRAYIEAAPNGAATGVAIGIMALLTLQGHRRSKQSKRA